MARFVSLYSGSSGNAFYAGGKNAGILIDVGVSFRALNDALSFSSLSLECIKAVFITHEHSDHIKGLEMLLKKADIPVYASEETLGYIEKNISLPQNARLCPMESAVDAADISVKSFDTPHDSLHSFGYTLTFGNGKKLSLATDLGHVSEKVFSHLEGSELVVIESNYDPDMLRYGPYPFPLKQRIASPSGHLSNSDCAQVLPRLIDSGTTRLVLVHLSEKNNSPALAERVAVSTLERSGKQKNDDYTLLVAPRCAPAEAVIF